MKQKMTRLAMLLLLASACAAQPSQVPATSADAKLDTLLVKQEAILQGQIQLQRELLDLDPFPEGAFAIAFNLPMAIATSAMDDHILSGSLVWFLPNSRLELVVPVWHRSNTNTSGFKGTTLDLQGRLYFREQRSGMYWLAGVRQAWLSGRINDYMWGGDDLYIPRSASVEKQGVYVGVGYRVRSSHLYWNCNIALGRYFGSTVHDFQDGAMMQEDYILDAELLKFGWIF